jgi:hypothetical protein
LRVWVLLVWVVLLLLLRWVGHVHNRGGRGKGMTLQQFPGQVRFAWVLWMRRLRRWERGGTDGSTLQVVVAKVAPIVVVLVLGLLLVQHGRVSVAPPSCGRASRSRTRDRRRGSRGRRHRAWASSSGH